MDKLAQKGDLRAALEFLRLYSTTATESIIGATEFEVAPPGVRAAINDLAAQGRLTIKRHTVSQIMTAYIITYAPLKLRPSWDEMGMSTAELWSNRSVDTKHKVGACILSTDSHTVVSIGFNGRHPGSAQEERASPTAGESQFVHAEANALLRANWRPGETHTLYVTHEPCPDCALLILAVGGLYRLARVVYKVAYVPEGRERGSQRLRNAGMSVMEWGA